MINLLCDLLSANVLTRIASLHAFVSRAVKIFVQVKGFAKWKCLKSPGTYCSVNTVKTTNVTLQINTLYLFILIQYYKYTNITV